MSPTLALLSRSLREENRQRQTYAARGLLVAFVLFLLFTTQQSSRYSSGAPGLTFFGQIIYLNLWFVSLAGLSYFAAAVAEEKEEATLGLLRMTNLGPLTILLGKSTSRLLGVAALLAVQLPFTLLAVTLGGISAHQVLAGYAALGAYIFFLCNLALVFSVACSRVGVASALTAAALLAFFLGPLIGKGILDGFIYVHLASPQSFGVRGARALLGALAGASPAARLGQVMRTGFSGPVFGWQALADVGLGLACFGLAWAGFDRFTRERRERGGSAGKAMVRRKPRRWAMWRAGRPWRWPVLWKDFFLVQGGWRGWVLLLVVLSGVVTANWLMIRYQSPLEPIRQQLAGFGQILLPLSLAVGAFQLALGCARIFRVEIQGKTLSGLAGLPVSMASIIWQKVGALLLATVPTAAFALGGFVLYAANEPNGHFYQLALFEHEFWQFAQVVFVTGTQFLLFLGVTAYFSLRLKRLALPMALAACFLGNTFILSSTAIFFRGSGGDGEAFIFIYHLLLLGVAVALGWLIGLRLQALAAEES